MNELPTLTLQSEGYSPTGNLAADGVRKLLGAPGVELIETLIREAVQNACDAAKRGIGPQVKVRLRRLTERQSHVLRDNVCRTFPGPNESRRKFEKYFSSNDMWVLEICDFGTTGLAGPTRADAPLEHGEATDFVNFLRNVGSKRDTRGGGGTYGYGKTALYLSSRCSAILVDTATTFKSHPVRRFMGCHLGEAYDENLDGRTTKRTGRHWWGVNGDTPDVKEPLEGASATFLSEQLGLPERKEDDYGSSIMILDPIFLSSGDVSPQSLMGMIAESFLWHFWPRMMRGIESSRRLSVSLELDGEIFDMPDPEEFSPIDILCASMRNLKGNDERVISINCRNPRKHLGRLNCEKGLRGKRRNLVNPSISIIPDSLHHVALMRPVELVVRYLEGEPLPHPNAEWGGVFRCDDAEEVESAFASSEPPAHDDWQPKIMPKGPQKTFVNVALRRIREQMNELVIPTIGTTDSDEKGPSLAKASSRIGRLLGDQLGQGAGPNRPSSFGNSKKTGAKIQQPIFLRLSQTEHGPVAIFFTHVHTQPGGKPLTLVAEPKLVMDGGTLDPTDPVVESPKIIGWSLDEEKFNKGRRLGPIGEASDVFIHVSMPGDYAVTVKLTEEAQND